ncbi:MAG: 30S ribosomal protein S4e [Thermoprotei archaeon]|nr:30S ribosomal protein S4e [Thermoprotei archaeon]
MGKMGGSRHLKALTAPEFWPILRKEYKWTVKPRPGPHSANASIPLLLIVRDVLGYALTAREARRLIAEGHFKVDGAVRKDYKFPVGFMDVIEIPKTGEIYRMLPYPVKFFKLEPISVNEAKVKPLRIEGKTTVKGGHLQLNLFDGRNVIVKVKDPRNPVEDVYETMGTLIVTIPELEIKSYIGLGEGKIAIVVGGKAVGRVGVIKSITWGWRRESTVVTLEDSRGSIFQTSLNYVYVIGEDKPLIKLPEGAWK